jgi:hypothetical protein
MYLTMYDTAGPETDNDRVFPWDPSASSEDLLINVYGGANLVAAATFTASIPAGDLFVATKSFNGFAASVNTAGRNKFALVGGTT